MSPASARYQTPMPWYWFAQRGGYLRFMAREATSILIAMYLVIFLFWLEALGDGPEAYAAMLEFLASPVSVVLHVLALIGALFHSITWFNLTPKIMPVYIAEEPVPDVWAALFMGYVPWVVVTAVIIWAVLR
jgi:fumarate reductase subunit C